MSASGAIYQLRPVVTRFYGTRFDVQIVSPDGRRHWGWREFQTREQAEAFIAERSEKRAA